jgi:large conductance mechanosensitive channel
MPPGIAGWAPVFPFQEGTMWKDFKTFVLRGNVVDLAIAVVVGTAFNAIVASLVKDVFTPLLLRPAMTALRAERWEELAWNGVMFGRFQSAVLEFIVTAFVLFLFVRALNAAHSRAKPVEVAAAAPQPPAEVALLTEIRDLLKRDRAAVEQTEEDRRKPA